MLLELIFSIFGEDEESYNLLFSDILQSEILVIREYFKTFWLC